MRILFLIFIHLGLLPGSAASSELFQTTSAKYTTHVEIDGGYLEVRQQINRPCILAGQTTKRVTKLDTETIGFTSLELTQAGFAVALSPKKSLIPFIHPELKYTSQIIKCSGEKVPGPQFGRVLIIFEAASEAEEFHFFLNRHLENENG